MTRNPLHLGSALGLAKETTATGIYTGKPGEIIRTLSPATIYTILRRNLGKLSGFGGSADVALAVRPADTSRLHEHHEAWCEGCLFHGASPTARDGCKLEAWPSAASTAKTQAQIHAAVRSA